MCLKLRSGHTYKQSLCVASPASPPPSSSLPLVLHPPSPKLYPHQPANCTVAPTCTCLKCGDVARGRCQGKVCEALAPRPETRHLYKYQHAFKSWEFGIGDRVYFVAQQGFQPSIDLYAQRPFLHLATGNYWDAEELQPEDQGIGNWNHVP